MVRSLHFWPVGLRADPATPVVPSWDDRCRPSECRSVTVTVSLEDLLRRLADESVAHILVPVPAAIPCRRFANRLRARLALLKATCLRRWTVRVSPCGRAVDVRRVGRWPTLKEKALGIGPSDLVFDLPRIQSRGKIRPPSEECAHQWIYHGYDRYCRKRLRCQKCSTTKLAEPPVRRFGMYLAPEKMAALDLAFSEGLSTRASAKQASVAYNTALKYRLLVGDASLCLCGQPAGHIGWCSIRFSRSMKRQEVMRRMQAIRATKQ